jgi:hypothetical protein
MFFQIGFLRKSFITFIMKINEKFLDFKIKVLIILRTGGKS